MHLMEVRQALLEREGLERRVCFHGFRKGHTACVAHTCAIRFEAEPPLAVMMELCSSKVPRQCEG